MSARGSGSTLRAATNPRIVESRRAERHGSHLKFFDEVVDACPDVFGRDPQPKILVIASGDPQVHLNAYRVLGCFERVQRVLGTRAVDADVCARVEGLLAGPAGSDGGFEDQQRRQISDIDFGPGLTAPSGSDHLLVQSLFELAVQRLVLDESSLSAPVGGKTAQRRASCNRSPCVMGPEVVRATGLGQATPTHAGCNPACRQTFTYGDRRGRALSMLDESRDALFLLQRWYLEQCDGRWEHDYGVKIDTLDNPGWTMDIDLAGTDAPKSSRPRVTTERTEHDWIHWWVEDETFHAACGPANLAEAVIAFLHLVGFTESGDE
jgi:Immunity protein 53